MHPRGQIECNLQFVRLRYFSLCQWRFVGFSVPKLCSSPLFLHVLLTLHEPSGYEISMSYQRHSLYTPVIILNVKFQRTWKRWEVWMDYLRTEKSSDNRWHRNKISLVGLLLFPSMKCSNCIQSGFADAFSIVVSEPEAHELSPFRLFQLKRNIPRYLWLNVPWFALNV